MNNASLPIPVSLPKEDKYRVHKEVIILKKISRIIPSNNFRLDCEEKTTVA